VLKVIEETYLNHIYVHKIVAEFGFNNISRLVNVKYDDIDSNSFLREYAKPDSYKLVYQGSTSKVLTKFSNISNLNILKGVYYQPIKNNLASIDSFIIVNDDVFACQVTVGEKEKGIKASGLTKFYEVINKIYPNLNYYIIFLCPDGDENKNNFKAVKIAGGKAFYKLFRNIPVNVRKFEGNQWITEFGIKTSYEKNALLDE